MSTVVITGGSRGIGAAAVEAFAARDYRVYFLYEKNHDAAQAVAAQPASIAQIEEMIASVNMFVAQTSMTLGQMKAAEAQAE